MELELRNGDYVPDGVGGLRRVRGREALLQRVFFRLTARRGGLPFLERLGGGLWSPGQEPGPDGTGTGRNVELQPLADGAASVEIQLDFQGETLAATVEVRS